MNHVVNLMKGSTQFNITLLEFIEFTPTETDKTAPSLNVSEDDQYNHNFMPYFFDAIKFAINDDDVEVIAKNHTIRLNPQQKPKTYYIFDIEFKTIGAKIHIEKLYGEFKRIHAFILSTFKNEIKEYERFEQITAQGAINDEKDVVIAPLKQSNASGTT
jgi:hypothetical protein